MLGISGLELKSFRPVSHTVKSEIFESYISNIPNDHLNEQQSAVDPHIWLDPKNAKVITTGIVKILSEFDTENSQIKQPLRDRQ